VICTPRHILLGLLNQEVISEDKCIQSFDERPQSNNHLKHLMVGSMIVLKLILINRMARCLLDSCGLE
jgi:hypothetical protein